MIDITREHLISEVIDGRRIWKVDTTHLSKKESEKHIKELIQGYKNKNLVKEHIIPSGDKERLITLHEVTPKESWLHKLFRLIGWVNG